MRRNEFIHKHNVEHPNAILSKAHKESNLFLQAQTNQSSSPGTHPTLVQWNKPPIDYFKVNWDAAYNKRTLKIGIGVIVKDAEGKVCGTLQANKPFLNSSFTAEALALWHAIWFYKEAGFYNLILEGHAI